MVLHLFSGRHPQHVNHASAGNLHLDPIVDPFALDVGNHIVAITGVFNGATLMIERRVPDVHAGDSIKRPDGGPPIPLVRKYMLGADSGSLF